MRLDFYNIDKRLDVGIVYDLQIQQINMIGQMIPEIITTERILMFSHLGNMYYSKKQVKYSKNFLLSKVEKLDFEWIMGDL